MYTIKDTNIHDSNYQLTELDEKIYNETGYILKQLNDRLAVYEKKNDFNCEETLSISINKEGYIDAVRWFMNNNWDHDFEIIQVPEDFKELGKLKYKELCSGYWSK